MIDRIRSFSGAAMGAILALVMILAGCAPSVDESKLEGNVWRIAVGGMT